MFGRASFLGVAIQHSFLGQGLAQCCQGCGWAELGLPSCGGIWIWVGLPFLGMELGSSSWSRGWTFLAKTGVGPSFLGRSPMFKNQNNSTTVAKGHHEGCNLQWCGRVEEWGGGRGMGEEEARRGAWHPQGDEAVRVEWKNPHLHLDLSPEPQLLKENPEPHTYSTPWGIGPSWAELIAEKELSWKPASASISVSVLSCLVSSRLGSSPSSFCLVLFGLVLTWHLISCQSVTPLIFLPSVCICSTLQASSGAEACRNVLRKKAWKPWRDIVVGSSTLPEHQVVVELEVIHGDQARHRALNARIAVCKELHGLITSSKNRHVTGSFTSRRFSSARYWW